MIFTHHQLTLGLVEAMSYIQIPLFIMIFPSADVLEPRSTERSSVVNGSRLGVHLTNSPMELNDINWLIYREYELSSSLWRCLNGWGMPGMLQWMFRAMAVFDAAGPVLSKQTRTKIQPTYNWYVHNPQFNPQFMQTCDIFKVQRWVNEEIPVGWSWMKLRDDAWWCHVGQPTIL